MYGNIRIVRSFVFQVVGLTVSETDLKQCFGESLQVLSTLLAQLYVGPFVAGVAEHDEGRRNCDGSCASGSVWCVLGTANCVHAQAFEVTVH